MRETLYLETSVISYNTGRPSRDLIVLAHQEITWDWWPVAKEKYDMYISEVVLDEAGMGDPNAATKRLEAIRDFPQLILNEVVEKMTQVYIEELEIPEKVFRDATHIAVSSVHNMDYLVTWNCSHIANVRIRRKLETINERYGLHTPLICTPIELEGGYDFVERPDS
jgi:hypothetical protein